MLGLKIYRVFSRRMWHFEKKNQVCYMNLHVNAVCAGFAHSKRDRKQGEEEIELRLQSDSCLGSDLYIRPRDANSNG